jgi:prepilin-type N-terminal cleavage/methylation domain-containing protein
MGTVIGRRRGLNSFTLIEMLVVIGIIAILAALTLAAGSAVMNKASRSRASSEVQAMSTALESYKTDNGIYPSDSNMTTNSYGTTDGSIANGPYQLSSQDLYTNLSGQAYFNATPVAGVKSYMSFKANQVGNLTGPASYVKDPWGYSYGYSSQTNGATSVPFNGGGFFDIWSTGGLIGAKATNTAAWLSNWQ